MRAMTASIHTFELDPTTLREAEEDDEGMVIFGSGPEPFDPDDFLVIEMPLAKYRTLGEPTRLTVSIRI